MVLFVVKWDIHPDKTEAYLEWLKSAVPRTLAVPGVVEFRAFRGAAGAPQIVTTYEFADMAAWAAWHSSEDAQKVWSELHTLGLNVTAELWGPSPVMPAPIRPGG
jgi:quinol monooxygenase YgiN